MERRTHENVGRLFSEEDVCWIDGYSNTVKYAKRKHERKSEKRKVSNGAAHSPG